MKGYLNKEWRKYHTLQIPTTVTDLIRRRLACLSLETQETLSVASVVGREFEPSILKWLTGAREDRVFAALDEARVARIVGEISDDFHRYRFTHVLIWDTLYEDLPRTRRVKLHGDLAVRLEQLFADEIESHLPLLAHHFCRGVPNIDGARASAYAARAGKAARDSLAYEEAASYYVKALELSPLDRCAPAERCETMLALGDAQARGGDWLAARRTYGLAGSAAKALRESEKFARAAAGFKGLIPGKYPPDQEAIAMLREALELLGPVESLARARTLGELARALYFATEQGEATRSSIEAVAIARGLQDLVTLGNALEARVYTLWRPSDIEETLRVASELIDVSSASGDRELLFRALMFRYACLLQLGDRAASSKNLDYANELSDELKNPRYRWQVALARSTEAFVQGDVYRSSRLSNEALRLGILVHDSSAEHYRVLSEFLHQRLLGNYSEELQAVISAAVEQYPQIAVYQVGLAVTAGGQSCMAVPVFGGIDSLTERIPANALQLFSLGILSEMSNACEDEKGACSLYCQMTPYAKHNIVVSWGAACDGSVSHYLGLLANTLGRADDAVGHFEDALEMNRRMNFVPFVARTQHYYAATLLERNQGGDRERAIGMLSDAITTYRRLGMQGYLRDALKVAATVSELSGLCETAVEDRKVPERIELPTKGGEEILLPATARTEETPSAPPEPVQGNLFRREGEYWTVCYRGRVLRLKSMRGLEYIAFLLGQPGKEVHALDLSTLINQGTPTGVVCESAGRRPGDDRLRVAHLGDAGPLLDSKSRSNYRTRIGALSREVAEAEQINDLLKASAARREMEILARELSAGTRRGGGPRMAGSYAERARVNVRNNISTALRAIRRHDEELWRHLYRGVRTGTFCAYIPEAGVDWQL
jgi:tetratricopeptide (TPR) repeat protein